MVTCVQVHADSVSNLHFADPSLKFYRVCPVFMTMTDWTTMGMGYSSYTFVPNARAEIIRSQYSSKKDQRMQGAIYYVKVHPCASWENLARYLFKYKEEAAIEQFRRNLPKILGDHHDCVACGMMHLP